MTLTDAGVTRIIGIGNDFRQDDGVGPAVVRLLKARAAGQVEIAEHDGDATSLLDVWDGASEVVLVDAVQSGAEPGTIHRVDVHASSFPESPTWYSGHSLSVADAVILARRLDRLPHALLMYGIEGRSFGFGPNLSQEVEEAVSAVVEEILIRLGVRFHTAPCVRCGTPR